MISLKGRGENTILLGDIFKESLPYKKDFFDTLVSFRVINHGKREEIENLVLEMRRVLKPNGIAYITVSKPSKSKDELPKVKKIAQGLI